jgi:hypothetical protein
VSYKPFLVADLREGLKRDMEPWLLPEKAYPTMENVFSYDGVINKKGGNKLLGRLGIREEELATRGAGNTNVALNLTWPPVEPGTIIITDGTTIFTDDGVGGFTITGGTGTVNVATNYTTGAIDITFTTANPGAVVIALYYVVVNNNSVTMGLERFDIDDSIGYQLIGFDLIKSYLYNNALQRFRDISFYKTSDYEINWTGSNSDFFWSTNYQNAFWATNNTAGGHFYAITGITNAAAAIITIGAHNFVNGDRVYIGNVQGMTQINNQIGTVTGTAATTITVNINSAAYGIYTSGGVVWSIEKSKAASGDGIRWYDNANGWVNFAPPLSSAAVPQILQGCLMMLPYKGRMLSLNTIEGTTFGGGRRYPQRVRFSQVGVPFVALSFPVASGITTSAGDSWHQTPGKGGFIDAPTSEEIVSAEFVKDVLVIFFERSTWKLDYTGNPVQPFIWTRLNSEYGSESTFSTVPFDKNATTVGSYAIASCNGADMIRIDDDIPEQVYDFHNENNGEKRVHGIRDYYNSYIMWTYIDSETNATYPNRVLVFNYDDRVWSVLKDYYTTYGYYRRVNDLTWGGATQPWSVYNISWAQQSLQSGFPFVVGGNTHGFIFEVQTVDHTEFTSNNDTFYVIQNITAAAPSVITCPNHGLINGDHVFISGVFGAVAINGSAYTVRNSAANTFTLEDENGTPVSVAGYTYGGRVTVVDNFELETKKFNPFYGDGKKVKIGYIDFLLDSTTKGEVTLELYHDEDEANTIISQTVPLVDPKSAVSNKFWYRAYMNVTAQQFSLRFKYTDTVNGQIFDMDNNSQDFKLHAWILWAMPAGRLTQ